MPFDQSILDALLDSIRRAEHIVVTSHARPDGDAIGSVLACWMMLRQMGKHADMILSDRVPIIYRSLPFASQIQQASGVDGGYDMVILLECDSVQRSGLLGLESQLLINIDHHASGRPFADVNWIAPASAVAEMVYHLAGAARVCITPEMATCLYTALLTDTGRFCYEGTDAHTLELAGDLVRHGANPTLIAKDVYFSNPTSKMLLLGAALANLHHEGQLSWLWVTERDIDRAGAAEEDSEGIVNYAISIAGVEAAAFFREAPGGLVRVSLRSKEQLNVAAFAERFGGGGHATASGCTVAGPLPAAMECILTPLREEIARAEPPLTRDSRKPLRAK
jgi:bifunctional oligoribonuclease and PAP phosphatase NrnA